MIKKWQKAVDQNTCRHKTRGRKNEKQCSKALTKAENGIMFAAFAVMVASSFAQVVNRNFFKLPITWFDEASTYCMIYMALIGTEIGLRDGTQIAVTAVVEKFSRKRGKRWYRSSRKSLF